MIPSLKQKNYTNTFFDYLKKPSSSKALFITALVLYILYQYLVVKTCPSNPAILWVDRFLFCVSMVFGARALYMHKDRLKGIEDDNEEEILKEKERWNSFPKRFPGLNILPVVSNIFRWLYTQGWVYFISLVLIIVIGFSLRIYRLDSRNIYGDEFITISVAAGNYFSGTFNIWDWKKQELSNTTYKRAWPHTWLMAQTYRLFGISAWSSRLVSVIFGTLLILFSYIVAKGLFRCKDTALLFSALISLDTLFIEWSRFARMYILFIPTYLIAVYLLYKGLTEPGSILLRGAQGKHKIRNKKILYLITGFLLLWISYMLHIIAFIFVLSFCLFYSYMSQTTKEFTAKIVTLTGVILLTYFFVNLLTLSFADIISHFNYITVRSKPHYVYWDAMVNLGPPLRKGVNIILIIIMLAASFIGRMRNKNSLVFLLSIILPAAIFFIYLSTRYASLKYISNVIPFSCLLITYSYVLIIKFLDCRRLKYLFLSIPIIFAVPSLVSSTDYLYYDRHPYGDFRNAYKTITENYKPGQVIFGQYLRTYYLQDLKRNFKTIKMRREGKYAFSQFEQALEKINSGWVTWETRKSYHVDGKIIEYCKKHLKQLHGTGVDNTKVEVYFFDKDRVNRDCESDFLCDGDVDAEDLTTFLIDFGRNRFNNPCTNEHHCHGDFDCDGNVGANDVTTFLEDFGRNPFNQPCPSCSLGTGCSY